MTVRRGRGHSGTRRSIDRIGQISDPTQQSALHVFTFGEKRQLASQVFCSVTLDRVDFSGADLSGTHFDTVSLRGCDFSGADLHGAEFLRCDLREANLRDVGLGDNRFHGSWLAGATGLTVAQTQYICSRGGTFVTWGDCPASHLFGDE